MRKRLFISAIIIALLITTAYFVWQAYDLSSDYNYGTAKLDIKNGDTKLITVGPHTVSSKDKEIESVAARYGFKNIYIERYSPKQTEKGVANYNALVENYLALRNGFNWKIKYQKEVDSLYKTADTEKK